MGPGIIIPVVLIAVVVPTAFMWAKRRLKDGSSIDDDVVAPGARLTSGALRALPTPPWRIVPEIAEDKLGGVEHVAIGPAGVFAVQTSMSPLPDGPEDVPDPGEIARAAIARGPLDDVLRRCAMSSDRLLVVHWGPPVEGASTSIESLPGVTAADGRALGSWAAAQPDRLTTAQVDLAWQTVTTAIGRPDPLS
jgi:hypothetical protein